MTAVPVLRPVPDLPPPAEAPDLRVARRTGRRRLGWTLATLLVLVTAVFAAVSLNAVAADDAVLVDQLDLRIGVQSLENDRLVTEVATLESPARIADAAAGLGLVRVDHPRHLHVERLLPADGIVHDRGYGTGATND